MKTLLISFYADTEGKKYYSECYKKLKLQLTKLKIPHHICELPNQGNWLKNCRMKPEFILKMLRKFEKPLVWLDIDATILEDPKLFDTLDCDFAASPRNWEEDENPSPLKLRASPLYINNTSNTKSLIEQWINCCKRFPALPDHHCLEKALFIVKNKLNFKHLPKSYSYGPTIGNKYATNIPSRRIATRNIESKLKFEDVKKEEIINSAETVYDIKGPCEIKICYGNTFQTISINSSQYVGISIIREKIDVDSLS